VSEYATQGAESPCRNALRRNAYLDLDQAAVLDVHVGPCNRLIGLRLSLVGQMLTNVSPGSFARGAEFAGGPARLV
jgi:hypothetical protein